MNLNDRITTLLKGGISVIHIGLAPDQEPFVVVEQFVGTGGDGNNILVKHQRKGSISECFELIGKDIEHCAKMQSKVLRVVEPDPQAS